MQRREFFERIHIGEPFAIERVRACRAELEKIADLTQYTTSIATDDLDEVRSALGYDRINVYGGSYGSTTSLVYLRQHGNHVRSVAIFGVAPPAAKIPLSFARGVQESMNRLFADCLADAPCKAAYPDVASEFQKVLAQFDNGPVEVTADNIYTGTQQKVPVVRDAFVDAIRHLLYVPNAAAALLITSSAMPIVLSMRSHNCRTFPLKVGKAVPPASISSTLVKVVMPFISLLLVPGEITNDSSATAE